MTIHLRDGRVEHAEETDGFIVHFDGEDRPILIEVLDASDFLARLTKAVVSAESGVEVTV